MEAFAGSRVSENRLMNRRVCVRIGSVLSVAICWHGVGVARAQSNPPTAAAPPTPLPQPAAMVAVQQAGNPQSASAAIAGFIKASLARGADENPVVAHVGRKQIADGCPRKASVAYHNLYAAELNRQGLALVDPTAPLRVRVNVAIAVQSVAVNADSVELVPVTVKLLDDPSAGVAVLALKAAKPLVLTLTLPPNSPAKSPLPPAIVRSVDAHHADKSAGGILATYAYDALVIKPGSVPNGVSSTVLLPLYDPVLDLLEKRTAWYADGVVPAPDAEKVVGTFFTVNKAALPPKQTAHIEQDLTNLLANIAFRAGAMTDRAEINAVRDTVNNLAQALNSLSNSGALDGITHLGLSITGPVLSSEVLGAKGLPSLQLAVKGLTIPPPLPPLPAAATPAGAAPGGAPTPAAPPT